MRAGPMFKVSLAFVKELFREGILLELTVAVVVDLLADSDSLRKFSRPTSSDSARGCRRFRASFGMLSSGSGRFSAVAVRLVRSEVDT